MDDLTGCWIDDAMPRTPAEVNDRLLDVLELLDSTEAELIRMAMADEFASEHGEEWHEWEVSQWYRDWDLTIEDKISESLPDNLCAGWHNGSFCITEREEVEI